MRGVDQPAEIFINCRRVQSTIEHEGEDSGKWLYADAILGTVAHNLEVAQMMAKSTEVW